MNRNCVTNLCKSASTKKKMGKIMLTVSKVNRMRNSIQMKSFELLSSEKYFIF